MKLRIVLLALATCLLITETSNAQRGGRGGGGGGRGGMGGGGRGGMGMGGGGFGMGGGGFGMGGGGFGRGGGGFGIGGGGFGIGGFPGGGYGYGYGGIGGYGNGYYYGPGNYYYGPGGYYNDSGSYYGPNSTYVAPASYDVNAPGGMQITDVADDSAAKKAGLRAGDIITSVGGSKTETFEDLQKALANAKGEVEVAYLAGGIMKREKTMVAPRAGKIGVAVVFAYLP